MIVKYKKLNNEIDDPKKGTTASAGIDLRSTKDITIESGAWVLAPTGISIEIPEGYFGGVYSRSGLSWNKGLVVLQGVGVVDADYRGEVYVMLVNCSHTTHKIKKNERIGQLIIHKYAEVELQETKELTDTERGDGGFGSTGEE